METKTLGRYARLTADTIFKRAFAQEEKKELTIGVLNTFLEHKLPSPIEDITIKNPYILGQTTENRDAVLDIHCVDRNNNKFIVEMQVEPQEYFMKRSIYYSCKSIVGSLLKGKTSNNFDFPNTYSLNFLDFDYNFGENCTETIQHISLRNDSHPEVGYEHLHLAYVLLPRFKKSVEECESRQDKLIYTLCHAHELDEIPEQLNNDWFKSLFDVAEISKLSPMEYDQYFANLMGKWDRQNQLDYAEKKGRLEERAKWEKERTELFSLLDEDTLAKVKHKLGLT